MAGPIKAYPTANSGVDGGMNITGTVDGDKRRLDVSAALEGASTLTPATTPTIYNLSMPSAGTEYSQALNDNTKQILITNRGNGNLQVSFVSGQSGTVFKTIFAGSSWEVLNLNLTGVTLYLQSNKASQTAEIVEFV